MELDPFVITEKTDEIKPVPAASEKPFDLTLLDDGVEIGSALPNLQDVPSFSSMDVGDDSGEVIEEICINSVIGFSSIVPRESDFFAEKARKIAEQAAFPFLIRSSHGYDNWNGSSVENSTLEKMLDISMNDPGCFVCIGQSVGFFSRMADVGLKIAIPASPFNGGVRELVAAALHQRGTSRKLSKDEMPVAGVVFMGANLTTDGAKDAIDSFLATNGCFCWIFWPKTSNDIKKSVSAVSTCAAKENLLFSVQHSDGQVVFELEKRTPQLMPLVTKNLR